MPSNFLKLKLINSDRLSKQIIAILIDFLWCSFCTVISLGLRTDVWLTWGWVNYVLLVSAWLLIFPLFTLMGLYRAIYRYAGMRMMQTLGFALFIFSSIYFLIYTLIGVNGVPRSMGIMFPIIFSLGIFVSRMVARRWLGGYGSVRLMSSAPNVLIYGAGAAGRQLALGLTHSQDVVVVGFIDDDEKLQGKVLNGLKIYGPHELHDLVPRRNISKIFLAISSAGRGRRNEILKSLSVLRVQIKTLPSLLDLTSGRVEVSDLKELDVEDLLGREPVPPDLEMLYKNNAGKVVLVTGAGGSIGSELCRQILKTGPKILLLVELNEYSLYSIEQDLTKIINSVILTNGELSKVKIIPLLGDVRNVKRIDEILSTWRPSTIYHAAAYKHVPLVEHNPAEGVINNVFGTLVVVQKSIEYGVSDFVLISTDKAVRPTNIMGASKRLSEMVLQALAEKSTEDGLNIRLSMVRFGNVLGSSGSVVPLFRKQILNGGPITLTDERITRYFMTIPEAAQLVIQAGAMARGGDVFVLDMGESVKIIDLARKMIELSGLVVCDKNNVDGDIEIKVTGLRPGEKLYEELLIGDNPMPTAHARIMKAREDFLPWKELQAKLTELKLALDSNDVPLIRERLNCLVLGYKPESDVVDWVYLARQGTNDGVIL